MGRGRRTKQALVTSVAKSFIRFLEENDLKHETAKSDLKEIYESRFRPSSNELSVCFSRVLSTIKVRLNLCQVVRGRVIFGDGETAALRMLDSDESTSEEEGRDDMEANLRCTTCKIDFQTDALLKNHLASGSHHQQSVLRTIRQSVEKPDLVKNKKGIMVTSVPPGNENGVIESKVQRNKKEQITLIVENIGTEEVELEGITLLWKVDFFNCSDFSRIGLNGETLSAGGQTSFTIGFKNRREYGYSYVPVVFIFEEKNGSKFHILRFLAVHIVSDLHDALKPTAPYKAPRRAFKVPLDVKTTPGLKLPP